MIAARHSSGTAGSTFVFEVESALKEFGAEGLTSLEAATVCFCSQNQASAALSFLFSLKLATRKKIDARNFRYVFDFEATDPRKSRPKKRIEVGKRNRAPGCHRRATDVEEFQPEQKNSETMSIEQAFRAPIQAETDEIDDFLSIWGEHACASSL